MIPRLAALCLILAGNPVAARADYLEIRHRAILKGEPSSPGFELEKLTPGTLVEITDEQQQDGYYRVRTRAGADGFVYRTLARRHRGRIPSPGSVRIATFNIQNLGRTKLRQPDLVEKLADIVRSYPLVAVQELSDASNQVPAAFLARINERGARYDMLLSARTGRESDDRPSQEQYAFYFDTAVFEALTDGVLFDDSVSDFFQREPFVAQFKVRSGAFTFVIITIHTAPGVLSEIEHLDDVVTWARDRFPAEDDFIVLGDLNAGCAYATPEHLGELAIRDAERYAWLISDESDSNLAGSACAYDRIVATRSTARALLGTGVDRAFSDKTVSDHWPVWAEFATAE